MANLNSIDNSNTRQFIRSEQARIIQKITQQQGETTPNCMDSILVILVEVRDQIYLNISIVIYIYIYINIYMYIYIYMYVY